MSVTSYDLGRVVGADGEQIYDLVIRTQAEFEDMIADGLTLNNTNIQNSTWHGAKSVALIGQFTLSYGSNSGVKIPATVKQIHGYNGAKITITNFEYNSTTAKGGLWYEEKPEGIDCEIRNLEVDCTSSGGITVSGFSNCTNLTNCTGTADGVEGGGYSNGFGFSNCTNLTNCTGTANGDYSGYGFGNCTNLTNCTGTGTAGYGGNGFDNCTNLTNCTGTGNGNVGGGYGFFDCTNLTNCTGSGSYGFNNCTNLTNCIGTGNGDSSGYGFYDCSYANGCKSGDTPSTTGIWGGTNLKIDEDSCEMDT